MHKTVEGTFALLGKWDHWLGNLLPGLIIAFCVLLLFHLFARLAKALIRRGYVRGKSGRVMTGEVLGAAAQVFFMLSGIILALKIVGLERFITHVLAGAGIIGIVAGFAFKDIASNFFSGLLLKMQGPFHAGDWVQFGTAYGMVKSVDWFTTAIATTTGEKVFVPNQIIYGNTFSNFSAHRKRCVEVHLPLTWATDLDRARRAASHVLDNLACRSGGDPVETSFTQLESGAPRITLRFWIVFTTEADHVKALDECIMGIRETFGSEGIALA